MAGSSALLDWSLDSGIATFDRMIARGIAKGRNPRALLETAGYLLQRDMQKTFDAGGRPPWPRTRAGNPPLIGRTRVFMKSFLQRGARYNVFRVQGNTVVVGSAHPFAHVHKLGMTIYAKTKDYLHFKIGNQWVRKRFVVIPARPVAVMTNDAMTAIGKAAIEWMRNDILVPRRARTGRVF